MDEKIIYEYCVLRYVADVEREEFINIGLMMMSKRQRWMRCSLHIDADRIGTLFPKADLNRLRIQSALFTREDVPSADLTVEERYRWLAAVKSAIIQTSPSHPGIIPAASPHMDSDVNGAPTLRATSEGGRPISREEARQLLNNKFDELFRRLVL